MLRENNITKFIKPASGTLPSVGLKDKIYIIPAIVGSSTNVFEEWYYDEDTSTWEMLGGTGGATSNTFYDIVKIDTTEWTLNTSTNKYEANISHVLNTNKLIYQAYTDELSPNSDKEVVVSVDILDSSNLKIYADNNLSIEVFILALANVSTFQAPRATDAIDEVLFGILSSQLVVDPTDSDFYEYTINHNLGKTIVEIIVTANISSADEPCWFIPYELDSNNLKIVTMDNSQDLNVIIRYEVI